MSTRLGRGLHAPDGWVREEVQARLSQHESAYGKLSIGAEMLIGSGRK
jgi:hypothetical protein